MKSKFQYIIDALPYDKPFLFVDRIISISDHEIEGEYTFKENEYFYEGHFKGDPMTPGVILTECMAQIGLVCLALYALSNETALKVGKLDTSLQVVLSSTEIDFIKPVAPGEKVTVSSIKEYYRFQKLKCKVIMKNASNEIVCKGRISGMAIPRQ